MDKRDAYGAVLPPLDLTSQPVAATPTTFSYQPTLTTSTMPTDTATQTHDLTNGYSAPTDAQVGSHNASGIMPTSTPWYDTQWREPITYMLIVYVITSAIIFFGMCYYGYLDRRLNFHFSTRAYRRAVEERRITHPGYHDYLTASRLQDIQRARQAWIGTVPEQRRSSASTELGDTEEEDVLNIQREWAERGVFLRYDEVRQQRWAFERVAVYRPHFPPRTSSRRIMLRAQAEEDMAARRSRDAEVVRRLQQAGLI